jgi:hypothetical protein
MPAPFVLTHPVHGPDFHLSGDVEGGVVGTKEPFDDPDRSTRPTHSNGRNLSLFLPFRIEVLRVRMEVGAARPARPLPSDKAESRRE